MHSFRDNANDSWDLSLTVALVRHVKGRLKFDLTDVGNPELLDSLINDPVLLVDILFVLCEKQCEIRKLSDEDFGQRFAGDALGNATAAFLEELVDFFHGKKRETLRRALNAIRKTEEKAYQLAMQKLEAIENGDLPTAGSTSAGSPESSV